MRVKAFAPATVANVGCGFDVLGLALEQPGDTVSCERGDVAGVSLDAIDGDGGRLPKSPDANTASVAILRLLERAGREQTPIRVRLSKGLPLASGMGSSAASAVAAVVAANELLELGADPYELLTCALAGERVAAGAGHADNAAASLFGGFVLVRSLDPLDVVQLPVPEGLSVALVRPHLELKTKDSRTFLGDTVPLDRAVSQWANLGALVAGLYRNDFELIARAVVDHIAEPVRAEHVPGFHAVQQAALRSGAMGCSLSGSGPSVFALCRDRESAEQVSSAMANAFETQADLPTDQYHGAISASGARLVEAEPCTS